MSQKKNEFDIAIIGAGIAGLALANALDNSGFKVALIEAGQLPNRPDIQQGIEAYDLRVSALSLGNIQFLIQLGVWQGVESLRYQAFERMKVWDGEGTGQIHFDASEVANDALGAIVENRVLTYSLLENLSMSSNIKTFEQSRIEQIQTITEQDGIKQRIIFADKDIIAKLVVGADGANSFVRKHYEFKTREWDYGHHAIVCTVKTAQPHDCTAWQRFSSHGPVALLPLPSDDGHYCSVVWSQSSDKAQQLMQLNDEDFQEKLGQATEAVLGSIEAVSQRFSIVLRQRHAVNYIQHGVALVADAAHTIHPLAGLGINMGLQDVAVLAEELLRAKQKGKAINDTCVLSRYQRRRKGENLMVMSVMEAFKRLFEQRSLPLLWLRNRGMTGLGHLSLLKQQIMKHVMGV